MIVAISDIIPFADAPNGRFQTATDRFARWPVRVATWRRWLMGTQIEGRLVEAIMYRVVGFLWCLWCIKLWVLGGASAATRIVRGGASRNQWRVATATTSKNESKRRTESSYVKAMQKYTHTTTFVKPTHDILPACQKLTQTTELQNW